MPFIWTRLCSHGFTNCPISRANVRYYLRIRDDHELGSGCPLVCSFRCQWPSECYVCWVTEVQAGTHVKSSVNQRRGRISWPYRKDGSLPTLRTMAMNQMYGKETTASECPAELVKSSGIHESKPPSILKKWVPRTHLHSVCHSKNAGIVERGCQFSDGVGDWRPTAPLRWYRRTVQMGSTGTVETSFKSFLSEFGFSRPEATRRVW